MQQLRNPELGCPWDVEQTFSSIAPYTIEEAYEVVDAIERNDMKDLKSELGDLLFQVVFHSQMASESGFFDFNDVVKTITDKMISRHPHVFKSGSQRVTVEQQAQIWEKQKSLSKDSVLDGLANNMPELLKAVKLTKYAAVIGFDWPEINSIFDKLSEETDELKEAINRANSDDIEDELGDLLFVCANLARHLNIDPSMALRKANIKFEKRFRMVEKRAKKENPKKENFDLKVLDELWNQVKVELNNHRG